MSDAAIALVTGGARRIGAAIVRDLAAHGFAVAIHANRSANEAYLLAGDIRNAGGRAAVISAEFRHLAELRNLVPATVAALGVPTLLVNNASVFLRDSFGALEPDVWQDQFDINLRAPVFLAEAFAAALPADATGNIVNLIDQRVLRPTPAMPSYGLSKSALWAATRTLAQTLAPRIRVNAIGPGPTFPNPYAADKSMTREIADTLLKRPVDPADFGRAIRFLVETPSVTGQLLLLDSGQHLALTAPGTDD